MPWEIGEIIAETKSRLQPLSTKNAYLLSAIEYFKYYGLDLADDKTEHFFGTFRSSGFTLAGHIFKPVNYKAAVFILHGYLGHIGLLGRLIRYLLETGLAVAVYDLPGHGLSSGEPTAIDDFSQYSQTLDDFMKVIKPQLHSPYHIIGYSTGAAIIMDYLLQSTKDDCFDKVILAAPLLRCANWRQAKGAFKIFRRFVQYAPRYFRKVSSDKDFLKFVRYKDPLQAKKVSLKWVNAVFNWERQIAAANVIDRPIFVVQGTKDNIVDWKFNIRFIHPVRDRASEMPDGRQGRPVSNGIQSKFKNSRVEFIKNARHELFNESEKIRAMVFSQIKGYLEY